MCKKISVFFLLALLLGVAGCKTNESGEFTVKEADIYPFSDGQTVSLGSYDGFKLLYRLDDGTELLTVL